MPFPRRFVRRSSSPRRFVRAKRQGAWTGVGPILVTLTQNVASSVYLWSDLDASRLNMAGKGVHQRTLLYLSPYISDGSAALNYEFAWSVSVMQTIGDNTVPPAAVLRPIYNWESLCEKSPIDMGYRLVTPYSTASGTGPNPFTVTTLERDIQVKRRLDDTDALLLTMEFSPPSGSGATLRMRVASRTYVSW